MPPTSDSNPKRLRARWIIPANEPPIENGWLEINDGVIVGRGSGKSSASDLDLGDVAIIPGPVNAHTHLDLSGITERLPAGKNLPDWLTGVVAWRRSHPTNIESDIDRGLLEIMESGTVLVGDIATTDQTLEGMIKLGVQGTIFREVIGLRSERYEPLWEVAKRSPSVLDEIISSASPHAPYSTSPVIYRRAATSNGHVPVATHWLESAEEREFLTNASGPFREFLERIGAWTSDWKPPADLWEEYFPSGRWTLVHANYLTRQEIDRLTQPAWRERIAAVVYCPRTHAYFGHPRHPFRELLAAGIPVALGTDSLASNPDLSVFNDGCFLAETCPDVDPALILQMLTIDGAASVGWKKHYGNLRVGEPATFAVVPINDTKSGHPIESLFAPGNWISRTMVSGKWRHRVII